MDGPRFDDITKRLSAGASRRRVVKGLAGGIAAAGLAAVTRGTAGAGPSPCAAFCADQPGARGAQCRQACRACGGDLARVCQDPTSHQFTCCGGDTTCLPVNGERGGSGGVCCATPLLHNCTTDQGECGCTESTVCPGTCAGTCCPEEPV